MTSSSNPYDRFRKVLECSICLDVYEEPKTLKCAHEFCQYCLEDILVFHEDGSVTITCPLRCEEKTHLNYDQTIANLGTPYTIKNMLDTLKEDTAADTKVDKHPLCQNLGECGKYSSVYCCGTIMCRTCHNNHMETSRTDGQHEKLNLTYNARENTLSVLCETHTTRCTHICGKDNQLLCVYCLHRDASHQDHNTATIEVEAQSMRNAIRKELQRSQRTEDSLLKTTKSIEDAKKSLKEVLEQRKKDKMSKDKSSLDPEMTRLIQLFDDIADSHLKDYKEDISKVRDSEKLTEKLDVEMALQKKTIMAVLVDLSNRPFKDVKVSLSDISGHCTRHLGDIRTTVVEASSYQSSFYCNWADPQFQSQKTAAADFRLKGNEYYKEKQYAKAIDCYSQAIEVSSLDDPSRPLYYQNLAAANEQLENWVEVVENCTAALKLDPMFGKALRRRSRVYERLYYPLFLREAYEDIVFVHHIERDNGAETSETIESMKRTLHNLADDLAEQQLQKKCPLMLPPRHMLRSVIDTFRYDPFTIELSATNERDANYSEILRNLKRGKYGNVVKFCDKEIESQGCHRDRALLLRGFIKYCMQGGFDDTTIDDFYGVLEYPQNDANALLHLTARLMIANRQLFVEEDIPGGMFFLESARDMGIEKATVYAQEGQIHKQAKRIREAKRCFKAAISLDRAYFEPRLQFVCMCFEEAMANACHRGKAEKEMVDFIRDFPDNHKSWLMYGNFLSEVGRYDEALEKFDKAMQLDPTDPEAFSCKARCLCDHYDDKDEAEKFWLKAIKIDKRNGQAYSELGYMEFKRVNWEAAWKYLPKAVEFLAQTKSKTVPCFNWMEYMKAESKYYQVLESYQTNNEGCAGADKSAPK